ncbi:rab3 GTPase-activating protein catalytic subunit [Orussus abietinus]|uniref:rab3 GTPase-activating protein catalytic subunit n=1 Tax=Orussus abietinus TaxID=222816 RepID=UPI000625AFE3|nr:rab3 GTPase-activating protein catalytic subunit [Orussus abietinus]
MENVEIEDYHHHDFTTATEWEVFIARLEEIIREWKLPQTKIGPPLKSGDFLNLSWDENVENLHFADVEFSLKHYKLKVENVSNVEDGSDSDEEDSVETKTQCQIDCLDTSNDFLTLTERHLELANYFGIREFIILVPTKQLAISDETRIKILVSSLTIASHNAHCEVPAFVQIHEPWQKFYLGISVGQGIRTHFEMVHLKKVPPHCRCLNGLLALFKQKIGESCGIRLDPTLVSIRFSYLLKDWTNSTWTQEPPDFDFLQGKTLGVAELGKLPFGATLDPVGELHLFATWPQMLEYVIVESETFSDLEPPLAPEWSVQVSMVPSPACLLGEYLRDFLQLCYNQKTIVELLGDDVNNANDDINRLRSALNVLTASKIPTLSDVVGKATARKRTNTEGPITEELLLPIIYFLFPDADEDSKTPYDDNDAYSIDEDQWKGVKSSAVDGLVWRLAIVAAHCTQSFGGAAALAQLWHEFVQEIRFRWEKSISIPGVGPDFPDCVRTCLLNQKLQMMNCCIQRKQAREHSAYKQQSLDFDDSESEEEFFECTSEQQTEEVEAGQSKPPSKTKHSLWNRPSGRLTEHPSLRLIHTGETLYLPITQDPVPKTEDQLEEDAQVMMQLGTDQHASEMRARLMSASLLSDMESFKAANPGAEMEDFIRWYSPRDWIEDADVDEWGQQKGHLSPRMMIPNNPWAVAWKSAQPVPAHRQKRLFDDTREAEKALHFLASRRINLIAQLLLPSLTNAALNTLGSQKADALPNLPEVTEKILNKLQVASKPLHQNLNLYEEIIHDIEGIETLVAQVYSLQHKLGGNDNSNELTPFLIQLMRGKEVSVPKGAKGNIGLRITTMFRDAQRAAHMMTSVATSSEANATKDEMHKAFPEPTCKEYILRTSIPRPTPVSTRQAQRMYAYITRDCIRLAGSFSEDTVFI